MKDVIATKYVRSEQDSAGDARPVKLSEKDISAALRLLKTLVGNEDEMVRSLSDVRDAALGIAKQSAVKDFDWTPLARSVFLGRRRRNKFFPASMIGEPAWDMMLALFITERSESRMSTTRLAEYAGSPLTTALRWIEALEQREMVARRPSPVDKRIIFVELTKTGRETLNSYFASLGTLGFSPDQHI